MGNPIKRYCEVRAQLPMDPNGLRHLALFEDGCEAVHIQAFASDEKELKRAAKEFARMRGCVLAELRVRKE